MKKRLRGVCFSGILLSGIVLSSVALTGCASSTSSTTDTSGRSDPLEGFNRAMFNVNFNVLDPYVVRPIAVGWRDYMPQPARNGLTNFFGNLAEPAAMANSFMVGDVYTGMKHFTRFFLNTLLGMGGLIDVARMANPDQLGNISPRRFGGTLANYGVGYGPYMVFPVYGSFTLREEGGDMADDLYPPLSWLTIWMQVGKWTLEGLETRARLLDSDALIRNSPDPYIFMREAYFQRKDFLSSGGKLETEKNPNDAVIKNNLHDID